MNGECIGRLVQLGIEYQDAVQLRRIAITLHRWHELECGDGNDYGSWTIARGHRSRYLDANKAKWVTSFEHDDDGAPYMEHHHYLHGRGKDYVTYSRIADRENGAKRRLVRIIAKYLGTGLSAYIQTDPRGASLYIGKDMTDENYTRGVAVYK